MGADQSTRGNRVRDRQQAPAVGRQSASNGNESRPYKSEKHGPEERDMGTLVVVKPALEVIDVANDLISVRLRGIPSVNPIFLNKDKLAWTKEGERARQRIDPNPLLNIGLLIQTHMRRDATSIARKQNKMTVQVKATDREIGLMIKSYTERQRRAAKQAENVNRINEFAHLLAKCQAILNDCKRSCQLLNEMLPEGDKLSPFTWAEDEELVPLKRE